MSNLIPGEPLIYERVGQTIYAKYRNRPDIPRWIVGTSSGGPSFDLYWEEWIEMTRLAAEHPTMRQSLQKALEVYYLLRDTHR